MRRLRTVTLLLAGWTLLLLLALHGASCWVHAARHTQNGGGADEEDDPVPHVFLTVSSLASHSAEGVVSERLLELNWADSPLGLDQHPDSWVGLFDVDPRAANDSAGVRPIESCRARDHPDGYYRTQVAFPRHEFSDDEIGEQCLGFWIGYVHIDRVLSAGCVRLRSRWMGGLREVLGNRTVRDLFLPGTHNAGSYEPYRPDRNTPKTRYQICHDESVFNQLAYGNRFLDLRVIFQHVAGSKEKLWISHSILRTNNTVRDVLLQVKRFLDLTRHEVVVLDFHLFYMGLIDSWVDDRHKDLMKMIVQILGQYMMPASYEYSTPLSKIWASGKRLLVGYASKQAAESNLLFPGAFHLWGNVETRDDLEKFLDRNLCRFVHRGLWSAMAELTPTTAGVLVDKYGGLRKLAQDVNLSVTKLFRDRWWRCANIVATDFFLGNGIVEVAIEANAKRFG